MMAQVFRVLNRALISTAAAILVTAAPVFADKPPWAGAGKGGNGGDGRRSASSGADVRVSQHFGDRQKVVVREYYVAEHRRGHCPPGLAKKNNGCMPPGQAKKWRMGHPLPREVIYYDLPPALVVEIGAPPPGYRFVRVASDILMIAIGTGLVVDAIQDLGRL